MMHPTISRTACSGSGILIFLSVAICFSCAGKPDNDGTVPEDALKAFAEGKRLYLAGKTGEARDAFRTVRRSWPRFIQNVYMEGKCAYLLGEYEEAVEILSPTVAAAADSRIVESLDAMKWLARSYLALNQPEDALAVLEQGLQWSAEDAELLLLVAKAHRQEGRMEAALGTYHRAEALMQRLSEVHLDLAEIYREAGFSSRAADHLERALALFGEGSGLREPVESLLDGIREESRR